MTNKNTSEKKHLADVEEFEMQFFNEISKLTPEQWLDICLRFEEDEDNITACIRKITRIRSKILEHVFKDDEDWKHRLRFYGRISEKQKGYFLKLPEMIEHNGKPYLLGATAYHVTVYAYHSFVLLYESQQVKNKQSMLIPCLRPFHGYATLPSFDFTKKPSESKNKTGPQSIKFSDVASEGDFVFHIAFPDKYFTYHQKPSEWDPFPPRHFNKKDTSHVTWNFDRFIDLKCSFGGSSSGNCNICGGDLSHLITLPALNGMPYTGLRQLTLSTCMKCVGWVGEPLFFKHDNEGRPQPCPIKEDFEGGEGDGGVIRPATVYSKFKNHTLWVWSEIFGYAR
ncbi:MAG: hypothetical protein WA081_04665 [Desulfosalsimonadaceae bacterium]